VSITNSERKRFSFSKIERLTKDREFERIFRAKNSYADNNLIIYVYQRDTEHEGKQVRLGLVTKRKLGKAVIRNKLKRRLREIFRLNKHRLKPGLDIIFLPRENAVSRSYQELENSVLKLFQRADLYANTNRKM